MPELDTQKLIDMNYRALTLLGFATAFICEYRNMLGNSTQITYGDIQEKIAECTQFLTNVENVVYFDKPMVFSKEDK